MTAKHSGPQPASGISFCTRYENNPEIIPAPGGGAWGSLHLLAGAHHRHILTPNAIACDMFLLRASAHHLHVRAKKTPAKSSADASHVTIYLVTVQPNQCMAEL